MTQKQNGVAVLDRVRAALAEAHASGQPRPGRPTLARTTGATEHQIRKALATLQHEHVALRIAKLNPATLDGGVEVRPLFDSPAE